MSGDMEEKLKLLELLVELQKQIDVNKNIDRVLRDIYNSLEIE